MIGCKSKTWDAWRLICLALLVIMIEPLQAADLPRHTFWLDAVSHHGSIYLVGEHGLVVQNQSGEWATSLQHASRSTLTSIEAYDDVLFVTGHDGLLLRYNSGSWEDISVLPLTSDTPSLLAIACPNTNECLAVGQYGAAFFTQDGAKTWSQFTVGGDFEPHLYDVHSIGSGHYMVAAENGSVYRTADRGQTWAAQELSDRPLFAIEQCVPGKHFVLGGGNSGMILESADDGQTWRRLSVDISQWPGSAEYLACSSANQLIVASITKAVVIEGKGEVSQTDVMPFYLQGRKFIVPIKQR